MGGTGDGDILTSSAKRTFSVFWGGGFQFPDKEFKENATVYCIFGEHSFLTKTESPLFCLPFFADFLLFIYILLPLLLLIHCHLSFPTVTLSSLLPRALLLFALFFFTISVSTFETTQMPTLLFRLSAYNNMYRPYLRALLCAGVSNFSTPSSSSSSSSSSSFFFFFFFFFFYFFFFNRHCNPCGFWPAQLSLSILSRKVFTECRCQRHVKPLQLGGPVIRTLKLPPPGVPHV